MAPPAEAECWSGTLAGSCLPLGEDSFAQGQAGVVEAVGKNVTRWAVGDRVTLPFVCGCGYCLQCAAGQHQVCDNQVQPGFTHWGSFAEYVATDHADVNLVRLPAEIDWSQPAGPKPCTLVQDFSCYPNLSYW